MSKRSKARIIFFLYILVLLCFDTTYSFMIFNLFLAFAALEFSFLLPLFRIRNNKEIVMSMFFVVTFILLSPNAIYVVTDLIHLTFFDFDFMEGLELKEWWNFTILVSGVFLALFYYVLMMDQVRAFLGRSKWMNLILLLMIILSSIGVYIGRFLRFHSIHIFTEPLTVVFQIVHSLDYSSVLFIGWMTILQIIICWLFLDEVGVKNGT